jgi:lipopolysaccharide transport system ATP-binding protein
LDHGLVEMDGSVEDVIRAYDDQNSRNSAASGKNFDQKAETLEDKSVEISIPPDYGHNKGGTGDVICTQIGFLDADERPITQAEFNFRETHFIEAEIFVREPQEDLLLRYTIDAAHYRYIAILDSYEQGYSMNQVKIGHYRLRVKVNSPNLRPGSYTLNMAISRRAVSGHLFYWFGAARFIVKHPKDLFLYADSNAIVHLDADFMLTGLSELHKSKKCRDFSYKC